MSYSNDFPLFNSGVVPVRRTKANAKGQRVICLLYTNGAVKELDPSWRAVTNFADGLAIVKAKTNGRDSYFYINVKGEKVYPHLKIYGGNDGCMRPLSDGLRAYPTGFDSWGYIDANGKVVARRAGTTIITAKVNGKVLHCTVTVRKMN